MKAYLIQYVLKSYLWIHHPLIRATTVLDHFLFICHKQHLWSDTHVMFQILAHWKDLFENSKSEYKQLLSTYLENQMKFYHIWIKATFNKLYTLSTYFREPQINTLRYFVFSGFHIKRLTFQNCFCFSFFGIIACLSLSKKVVSQKL